SLKSNIMKGGIFSSKTLRKNESPSNRGMFPIVNMTIVKSRAYLRGKNHRKVILHLDCARCLIEAPSTALRVTAVIIESMRTINPILYFLLSLFVAWGKVF